MDSAHIFWGECRECGNQFEFVADYGDSPSRTLRSTSTLSAAKIMYLLDPVFDEVADIVYENCQKNHISRYETSERFDKIFGKICDPAPDGSYYDMSGYVVCPKCRSDNPSYGPTDPPKYIDIDKIPNVSHHKWDKLNSDEKKRLVETLLQELE